MKTIWQISLIFFIWRRYCFSFIYYYTINVLNNKNVSVYINIIKIKSEKHLVPLNECQRLKIYEWKSISYGIQPFNILSSCLRIESIDNAQARALGFYLHSTYKGQYFDCVVLKEIPYHTINHFYDNTICVVFSFACW